MGLVSFKNTAVDLVLKRKLLLDSSRKNLYRNEIQETGRNLTHDPGSRVPEPKHIYTY
jgi:hypothetical protein